MEPRTPRVHVDTSEPWLFVCWGSQGKPPKNGRARRVPLFGIGLAAMKEWLRLLPSYSPKNPHALAPPSAVIAASVASPHAAGRQC